MSDAVRRAVRTFFQSFLGVLIASGIFSAMGESGVVDWAGVKKVAVSAVAAGVVALLSFVQNSLEDHGVVPEVIEK